MIVLGIESTAHTFGIGIFDSEKNKILSNVKHMFKPPLGIGMLPREASEHHYKICDKILKEALNEARIKPQDIDLISFAQGPGLGACLRIGASVARFLSLELKKPLVGVNHCIAHLEVAKITTPAKDPIMLYVSGGNTQIIAFDEGKYRVFGETQDIPVGNLFDVFARNAGLPMPGGPVIEKLALKGRKYLSLPYAVKGMDVSFSGILTSATKMLQKEKLNDICFSLQETAFSMLVEVSERAMAHCNKKELVLAGGVAANKRLREMCNIMCKERGAKFFVPEFQYCCDNGAMIAVLGAIEYDAGVETKIKESKIKTKWRTNEVEVKWV